MGGVSHRRWVPEPCRRRWLLQGTTEETSCVQKRGPEARFLAQGLHLVSLELGMVFVDDEMARRRQLIGEALVVRRHFQIRQVWPWIRDKMYTGSWKGSRSSYRWNELVWSSQEWDKSMAAQVELVCRRLGRNMLDLPMQGAAGGCPGAPSFTHFRRPRGREFVSPKDMTRN
jgi:hypothetical protein